MAEGWPLHVEVIGQGAPVLVLHGGPGLDHTYFRPWLDPLADRLTLGFLDFAGHGRSKGPAASDLDHEVWAGDIARAVEAMAGSEPVTVLAHSWGSFVALEHARDPHPRIGGLVLTNTAPALDYVPDALALGRARATDAQFERLMALLSAPVADDDAFREGWTDVLPVYFAEPDDEVIRTMDEDARYSAATYNRGMFECLPTYDVTGDLAAVDLPTLVLGGAHDWITPPAQGPERVAGGIPGASLEIFEDSGHFPFIEEPERFRRVVLAWMEAQGLA